MSNINYEAEVKKVYPDAYRYKPNHQIGYNVYANKINWYKITADKPRHTVWKHAYNTLKQQGKLQANN